MATNGKALSLQAASATEEARTADLDDWIEDNFQSMTQQEQTVCEQLLLNLGTILKDWVRRVGVETGQPSDIVNLGVGAEIYTSGSFRLGLNEAGSDIDIVVVAPKHVTRDFFFGQSSDTGLHYTLASLPQVTKLNSLAGAAVPILNFFYNGVEIDLGFASLARSIIPEGLDLSDDNLLRNVDDAVHKALNGPRVTNLINQITQPFGQNFIKVLRSVRIWARRRAIYSNKTGFLGGVNWSILVAFVCRLYPNQTAAVLLQKFFWVLKNWKWPNPITIHDPADPGLELRQWDAQSGWKDVMPILTPAYPVQNSSFTVTRSTLSIMQMEFERAYALTGSAMKIAGKEAWEALFEPSDFFIRFQAYIMITVKAATHKNLQSWAGWVESRLRKLVQVLENHRPQGLFKTIFPHPKPCKVMQDESGERLAQSDEVSLDHRYFVGVATDEAKMPKVGEHPIDVSHWTDYDVCLWNKKTDDMSIDAEIISWRGLPDLVFKEGRQAAATRRRELGYVKKKGKKRKAEAMAAPVTTGAAAEAGLAKPAALEQTVDTTVPPPPPPPPPHDK